MQLILAIAALCQVSSGVRYTALHTVFEYQTQCQQSYLHCVNVKKITLGSVETALEKCIMEKK